MASACYLGVDGNESGQSGSDEGSDGGSDGGQGGSGSGGGGTGGQPGEGCESAELDYVGLRRLTTPQLRNTLADLLATDVTVPDSFPRDDRSGGYISVPQSQTTSALLVEEHLDWMLQVAERVVADGNPSVITCSPDQDPNCGATIVTNFLPRAFRRPASDGEVDHFVAMYDTAQGTPAERLTLTLAAVLNAPQFVYRERETQDPSGPTELTGYDVATRLSYFLWETMPDEELIDLAAAGELARSEVLEQQVRRMIESPHIEGLARTITDQWLELSELWHHSLSVPGYDEPLRQAMREETVAFVTHVLREDRPLSELVTASYSYVNDRLAGVYGLAGQFGDGFVYTELNGDGPRRGLLTQPGALALTSSADKTSIVHRGDWVSTAFLCVEIPPPPDTVSTEIPEEITEDTPPRDVVEIHRADPSCSGCHNTLDPPGIMLETYGPLGEFRPNYPPPIDAPVDPSTEMSDGTPVADVTEFAAHLAEDPRFVECAVDRLMPLAVGRYVAGHGEVDTIARDRLPTELTMAELVVDMVTSNSFRCQAGQEET